jgi:hypothetical protein
MDLFWNNGDIGLETLINDNSNIYDVALTPDDYELLIKRAITTRKKYLASIGYGIDGTPYLVDNEYGSLIYDYLSSVSTINVVNEIRNEIERAIRAVPITVNNLNINVLDLRTVEVYLSYSINNQPAPTIILTV